MPSEEMSVTQARAEFSDVTGRVAYGGQTIYLTKNGRRAAAVVPADSAELLEELEEAFDVEHVRATLAALDDGTEVRVPFTRRTPRGSE